MGVAHWQKLELPGYGSGALVKAGTTWLWEWRALVEAGTTWLWEWRTGKSCYYLWLWEWRTGKGCLLSGYGSGALVKAACYLAMGVAHW
jgi:hypothetical protein